MGLLKEAQRALNQLVQCAILSRLINHIGKSKFFRRVGRPEELFLTTSSPRPAALKTVPEVTGEAVAIVGVDVAVPRRCPQRFRGFFRGVERVEANQAVEVIAAEA